MDPIDPELMAELIALVEARSRRPAKPKEAVRVLWRRFAAWAPTNRRDAYVVAKHATLILDLKFEYQGQEICMGDQPWDAVCRLMVDAWRDKLTTLKDRRFKDQSKAKPIGGAYRNRLLNTYQAFFTWCLERELVTRNPVDKVGREDETPGERQAWWSDEDFERHIPKAHPYLQLMARVAFRCGGMRAGEIRSLSKTRSVNWDERLITVRAETTKTRTFKVIPITDDCWPILLAQRDTSPSDLLFPNPKRPDGKMLPESTLTSWVRKWREDAGFVRLGENIVFHSCRQSFGVNSMLKHINLPHTMDIMGIKSPKIARKYMRLSGMAAQEDAREKMNERYSPKRREPPPDRVRAAASGK